MANSVYFPLSLKSDIDNHVEGCRLPRRRPSSSLVAPGAVLMMTCDVPSYGAFSDIVAADVSRISLKLILYVPSHMTNFHGYLMQKTCIYVCLLCVIYMFYCIYILHSCSKLESSHLINYPFIMTQVVCVPKSIMVFGQWLVAHAAPSHCVEPGLISHQYLNLSFHKQGS